jgi:hypothetical protein
MLCDYSTRSVGMNLARRFNTEGQAVQLSRRVATFETTKLQSDAKRRSTDKYLFPELKRRSKFNRCYASKTHNHS